MQEKKKAFSNFFLCVALCVVAIVGLFFVPGYRIYKSLVKTKADYAVSYEKVRRPNRCKRLLRYSITSHELDLLECVNSEGQHSVFYKGFSDTTWNERYVK